MTRPHRSLFILLSVSIVSVALSSTAAYAGPFEEMATHVPDDANAIALFNVEKIFNSPIAKAHGWSDSHEKRFADGMVTLPPDAKRCVMAAKVDYEFFTPVWEVTLLQMPGEFSLSQIARLYSGTPDQIAGIDAVYLPTDRYAVQLSPNLFGARGPGERQAVARWLQSGDSRQHLSQYLQRALSYSDQVGTEIILALDLNNVLSTAEIDERLESMTALSRKRDVDYASISRTLASIQGLTLGITFGKEPYGKMKVEFGRSTRPLAGHGKALLLEALGNHGAMIDDFSDWEPKTEGNLISIEGSLSDDGLMKLLSLFETPRVLQSVAGESTGAGSGQQQDENARAAAATKKYFASVQRLFRELRDKKPQRLSQYGVWFERYAQKIDNQPLVGVDKDMLDYGRYVAQSMRSASMAVKNKGIRTRAREVSAVASTGYGAAYYHAGGSYNGWTGRGNWGFSAGTAVPSFNAYLSEQQSRRTQVRTQETARMATSVQQIKAQVQEATAQIRRLMAERYQINL